MNSNRATPIGFDLRTPNPPARAMDHLHESDDTWTFCHGPDVQGVGPVLEVPKSVAATDTDAVNVACVILRYARVSWEAGEQNGRAEAQRFFRLILGVEEPTRRESAHWNNPVPLKPRKDDLATDTEARGLGWTS